jgi:hypothetical protein
MPHVSMRLFASHHLIMRCASSTLPRVLMRLYRMQCQHLSRITPAPAYRCASSPKKLEAALRPLPPIQSASSPTRILRTARSLPSRCASSPRHPALRPLPSRCASSPHPSRRSPHPSCPCSSSASRPSPRPPLGEPIPYHPPPVSWP